MSKKSKRKNPILLILILILSVILIASIVWLTTWLLSKNSTSKTARRTFYTNYDAIPDGACGYYEYTETGKRTNNCVDNVQAALRVMTLPNPDALITENLKFRLIKIDADVHTEVQKRSTASDSTPRRYNVIVIDKVYSAKLLDLPLDLNKVN